MSLQRQRLSWAPFFILFFAFAAQWSSAQTTVFFEGFEGAPANFTNRWRVEDQFVSDQPVMWGAVNYAFGGETAHSGTNKVYCAASNYGGTATSPYYQDNMSTYFERDFNLTNLTSATLSFWFKARMYVLNSDFDYINEFLWDTLTVYVDDIPLWDTSSFETPVGVWTPVVINLDDYGIVGGTHTVRFQFESDGGGQEDNGARGEGVYLDDIMVSGHTAYRADFNKDNVNDLVWWRTNGYLVTWFLTNGPTGVDYKGTLYPRGYYRVTEPGWDIIGQSDFNLDMGTDILLKHNDGRMAIWYMKGSAYLSSAAVNIKQNSAWRFAAMADFNNDKNRDIIWLNSTNRQVAIWMMKNNLYQWSAFLLKSDKVTKYTVLSGYQPVLMSDFNVDGSKDLLIQRTSDGALFIHFFYGNINIAAKSGEGFSFGTTGISPSGWSVMGGSDFNRDGHTDLLVQHKDGRIAVWYMNRNTVTGSRVLTPKTPLGWKLAGPR